MQAVSGGPVSPVRALTSLEKRLSLSLRGRYSLQSVRLFGHELVLAVESTEVEPATPAAYATHLAAIATLVQAPVVLVLTGINSTIRARLIGARVPFIVPGNQLFLPMLLVDLRERMTRSPPTRENALGSIAQLVILAHLQRQRMDALSLADAANVLGYSPMMLTKAKDELVAAGLCTVRAEGRSLRLAFVAQGRELWETSLPRLSSPVVRAHLVRGPLVERGTASCAGLFRAGVSALSDLTNLADDVPVTYAASKAVVAASGPSLERVTFEDDANARLEVWRHAPEVLSTAGRVDALSLYLSLRDNPDERVQAALVDMLEMVRW